MANHQASEQMVGYLYQVRYALQLLLDHDNTNYQINIEKFDDVAFNEDGSPRELIQLKHHVNNGGSLSDSSTDLWRTLKVWIDMISSDQTVLNDAESIGLFECIDFIHGKCPFCSNDLRTPLPEVDLLKQSILDLTGDLDNMTRELPKLRSYIEGLRDKKASINERIIQLKNEIESIYQLENDAHKIKDLNTRKAKVIGRISLWLESICEQNEESSLDDSIKALQDRIDEIKEALDVEAVNDRMSSLLSKMQTDMTCIDRTI